MVTSDMLFFTCYCSDDNGCIPNVCLHGLVGICARSLARDRDWVDQLLGRMRLRGFLYSSTPDPEELARPADDSLIRDILSEQTHALRAY